MAQASNIEWTDVTWNPVHGCSKVSPGCAHCYAETLSLRRRLTTRSWTPANAASNVLLKPHKLREPLSGAKEWQGQGAAAARAGVEGKLVFVNSMSDLFHEQVPFEFIAAVFGVMACAPQHAFQVLTKRPERARAFFDWHRDVIRARDWQFEPWRVCEDEAIELVPNLPSTGSCSRWPLPNVWLGVSIENRRFVGRADVLRETPAAVRFVSAEPLLGPLVRSRLRCPKVSAGDGRQCIRPLAHPGDCARSWGSRATSWGAWPDELAFEGIDWLIVGGESGPQHRRFDIEWARDLAFCAKSQCTAFFMKQLGGARSGGALEDLPEDLRIREFPGVAACA